MRDANVNNTFSLPEIDAVVDFFHQRAAWPNLYVTLILAEDGIRTPTTSWMSDGKKFSVVCPV
jgi:hypothetical protein